MGASLIIAIGAQNAFVLVQGIRRNRPLLVAGICALTDAVLISAGVMGIGTLVASSPVLRLVAGIGGFAFLFVFGLKSFLSAGRGSSLDTGHSARPDQPALSAQSAQPARIGPDGPGIPDARGLPAGPSELEDQGNAAPQNLPAASGKSGAPASSAAAMTLKRTVLATLAISLLNPHVYLDTVIMLGTISGKFAGYGRYAFGAGAICASFIWFFSLAWCGRLLAPVFARPRSWQVLSVIVGLTVWLIALGLALDVWRQLSNW